MQSKGKAYVQASANLCAYSYTELLMGKAIFDTQAINRHMWYADMGFYAEYGLTDKVNIIATLPFKYVTAGALADTVPNTPLLEEGSLFGMSNVGLGLKVKLLDKKWKVAASFQSKWNSAARAHDKGLSAGFASNA